MTPREVRAVLFDLDGVLIHSFEPWYATLNDVARGWGFPRLTRERMAAIWGEGIQEDARNLFPGRTVAEIRRAYEESMPRHAAATTLNPEAPPVLEALGRRGIRRAVVTNTQTSLAESILRAKGIRDAVDAVSALGSGLREKPSPDLVVDALARLGVDPAQAFLVGDTRFDEEAARAAGTGFLRYDFAKGESLASALAPWIDGRADPPYS